MTQTVARDLLSAYDFEIYRRGGEMIKDRRTQGMIWSVATWLVDGTKSGLWIMGPVGTGKTTMLKALHKFIREIGVTEGLDGYREQVECYYTTTRDVTRLAVEYDHRKLSQLEKARILILDEVGNESPETMAYGRVLTPIRDLLEVRYQWDLPTVVAGNLCDIREQYGERVRDRCAEMMDKIVLDGGSYRGGKGGQR